MQSSSMAELPDRFLLFWDQKFVRLLGGRPWVSGVIIAAVSFATFLALALGFGIYELVYSDAIPDVAYTFGMDAYTWAAFVTSLLTGFGFSASSFMLVQDEKDLKAVSSLIGYDGDELANEWLAYVRERISRGRLTALGFFAMGLAMVTTNIPGASDVLRLNDPEVYPWFQQVPAAWFLVFVPLNFALIGKGAYFTMVDERFHRNMRRAHLEIDLLHPEQLEPFTRMALRRSFLWIVGSSICLLLFLNAAVNPMGLLPFTIAIMVVASLTLIAPLTGIHHKISAAKKRELRTVRASIGKLRDEVLYGTNPTITNNAAQRLTGLVAYEGRLEKTSEWPLDLPTLGTFSFYLAIPVISWVGGALMERLIDALF